MLCICHKYCGKGLHRVFPICVCQSSFFQVRLSLRSELWDRKWLWKGFNLKLLKIKLYIPCNNLTFTLFGVTGVDSVFPLLALTATVTYRFISYLYTCVDRIDIIYTTELAGLCSSGEETMLGVGGEFATGCMVYSIHAKQLLTI